MEETKEQIEARLIKRHEQRQRADLRDASPSEYAARKAAMLADVCAALTHRPRLEHMNARSMTDAEYVAARAKLVRGGR